MTQLKYPNSSITNEQIKKIHTIKSNIRLSDDNYRALLFRFGAESSKDLNRQKAAELIDELENIATEQYKRNGYIKPKGVQLKGRLTYFDRTKKASDKQINYIASLWLSVSDSKTYSSLMWFIRRITGKLYIHIESLNYSETKKVLNALKTWENSKKTTSTHR